MKLSHYFFIGIIGTASVKAVLAQPLDQLAKVPLREIVEDPATAPLIALLKQAPPAPSKFGGSPSPEPTLPEEWKDFAATASQDPSLAFVGTLVQKNADGKYYSSSNPIFLIDKVCKPTTIADTKEDTVYKWARKMKEGTDLDLILVKLHFGHDEAAQLTLSRIGTIKPTSGIDGTVVDDYKKKLDVDHNKRKYWICTGQELFLTTYQKFHKDNAGGSGTYNAMKIDGAFFTQNDELKKLYNFRLQLVPLEDWH